MLDTIKAKITLTKEQGELKKEHAVKGKESTGPIGPIDYIIYFLYF